MNDMTDRDNITLPREVAYQVPLHELLESVPLDARLVIDDADGKGAKFIPVGRLCREAATALRAALAAEPTKPVRLHATTTGVLLGSAWLVWNTPKGANDEIMSEETADLLNRMFAENEALRRDAEQGRWLREWLDNNGLLVRAIRGESLAGYEHPDIKALRRDAERYRWLRGEHSRIDPCIKANAKYRLERDSSTWVNIHDLDAAIDAAMKEGT